VGSRNHLLYGAWKSQGKEVPMLGSGHLLAHCEIWGISVVSSSSDVDFRCQYSQTGFSLLLSGFLFFLCSLTRCLAPASLKLRPYGAIQICLLLLLLSRQHCDLIMGIHLGSVSTYTCFVLYAISKLDQTNDICLSGLSTQAVST